MNLLNAMFPPNLRNQQLAFVGIAFLVLMLVVFAAGFFALLFMGSPMVDANTLAEVTQQVVSESPKIDMQKYTDLLQRYQEGRL